MKPKHLSGIFLSGLVISALGCGPSPAGSPAGGGSAAPAGGNEILVGHYGSLTGDKATFGIMSERGALLAAEQVNAEGGILGKKIRILSEDDQGKPEEAANAVQKLVNQNRVVAVLGEVASSNSLAAAPICQKARVPMISPSSTSPKVTEVGDYIFRVCFIDPFQGTVMAKFARNTLKVETVAILIDNKSDYSVGLAKYFEEAFTKSGGRIVAQQSYAQGDSDFSPQLTAIRAASPQAIFVPGYYTEAGLIARQARGLNIAVPILGGDGWDSASLFEIGGKALDNTYYSNHYTPDDPKPEIQSFVAAFKAKYGEVPDGMGALGYDAARVLFAAMKAAGSTEGPRLRAALAATRDFPGVTGQISIDEQRNARKPAVVLQVKDGRLVYVETIAP